MKIAHSQFGSGTCLPCWQWNGGRLVKSGAIAAQLGEDVAIVNG